MIVIGPSSTLPMPPQPCPSCSTGAGDVYHLYGGCPFPAPWPPCRCPYCRPVST